jgi:hypothetical protein
LCFDISDLEKQTIPIENFSKPKLENKRDGIENTLNIWRARSATMQRKCE